MTYEATVLADSPVAYWRLNETSTGVFVDSSGNGHNVSQLIASGGLNQGNLLSTPGNPGGSSALSGFGGQKLIGTAGSSPFDFTTGWTLECWIKPSATPNGEALITDTYGGSVVGWCIGFTNYPSLGTVSGDNPFVGIYNGSSWGGIALNIALTLGTVYHMVGTWDGSVCKIYIDGVLQGTSSAVSSGGSNAAPIVGGSWGGGSPIFNGDMSEVALYNYALSSTRVAAHYTAGTVTAAPTTTALTVATNPVIEGVADTLTATISGGSSPTGTVTFYDGVTAIGTGTVTSAVATISPSFSTLGAHSLTAVYSGDSFNLTSTSPPVVLTVNGPTANPTTTTLTLSANPIVQGLTEALTATVVGTSPTGLVQFFSNGTLIGTVTLSAGVATLSYPFTTTGLYNLQATYLGDVVNLSSSSNAILSVVTPNPVIHGDVTPYLNLITSEYQNVS